MSTDLRSLSEAYVSAINQRDLAAAAALFHEDFILEDPAGRFVGKSTVLGYMQGLLDASTTLSFAARQILVETNRSVIEFILTIDGKRLVGTDVIEWSDGQMLELRAYLYPQAAS